MHELGNVIAAAVEIETEIAVGHAQIRVLVRDRGKIFDYRHALFAHGERHDRAHFGNGIHRRAVTAHAQIGYRHNVLKQRDLVRVSARNHRERAAVIHRRYIVFRNCREKIVAVAILVRIGRERKVEVAAK